MTDTASAVTDQVPEMVERMARAAFEQMVIGLGLADREWFHEWENQHPKVRADWQACIRAALEVAREPTAAMQGAGAIEDVRVAHTADGRSRCLTPSHVWRAMIDKALG